MTPQTILDFWLNQSPKAHFSVDADFDAEITEKFGPALQEAQNGAHDSWAETPDGALALIILLDQFSRNIHRGTGQMFATDEQALNIAKQALDKGFDQDLENAKRSWFYMPFMHSENLDDQARCVGLCQAAGLKNNVSFAIQHAEIIRLFGRFPHRNTALGRATTDKEQKFLTDGGFSG